MAFQAIIMAGGEGVRLRPMTLDIPKPLVPVLGEPVMGYSLKLLRRHDLSDVAATIMYLPQAIKDAFGKGEAYNIHLQYIEEAKPMGTAGSVKLASGMVADTFVILSGDGLTDCDLTEAIAFHKSHNALATLVLKSVPIPLSYGVVITDGQGRIQRFVEKPDWSGVFSDQVNTGIYILQKEVMDLIPEGIPYDFGKDLFPKMVKDGLPVYGYSMTGYWCDIGDQGAYLQSQLDLLRGDLDMPIKGTSSGHAILEGECTLEPDVRLEGLCYIGDGATIKQGATLFEGAVIGPGAIVEEGAQITKSCLWKFSRVGRCAHVDGAVICREAQVRPSGRMLEGSALGAGAILGSHAKLNAGVKVWPQKEIGSEVNVFENVVWGDLKRLHINENSQITVDSPSRADQLAASALAALRAETVALCLNGDDEALYTLLAGAFAARGVKVMMLGHGYEPILRLAVRHLKLPLGMMIDGQQATVVAQNGLRLDKTQIQAVESAALKQEYPPAFDKAGQLVPLSGMQEYYLVNLLSAIDTSLLKKSSLQIAVFCDHPELLSIAQQALTLAGIKKVRLQSAGSRSLQPWEIGFTLEADGTSAYVMDKSNQPDEVSQQMLVWQTAAQEGSLPLFAPPDAPRVLEQLGPVVWKRSTTGLTKEENAALLRQYDLLHDGILRMITLLTRLADTNLQGLLEQLPKTHRFRKDVPCPTGEKGRVLRKLCETAKEKELGEGLRIRHGGGSVWLSPFQDRAAFRIQTESFDAEFAGELCAHYAGRIEKLTQSNDIKDKNARASDFH